MSKENKGNQPERKLEAEAKHAPSDFSLYYTETFEAQFTYEILNFTDKPMS
jgi:hypothetical protein